MRQAVKLLLQDKDNNYLLLYRGNHPYFPYDPDLPGGTVEKGEEVIAALVREVREEIGVTLDAQMVEMVSESSEYNKDYAYYLYSAKLEERPSVSLSWEHSHYEWLDHDVLVSRVRKAVDSYMHMVYDYLLKK